MIRADIRADADRCAACRSLLVDAELRRILHPGGAVDVLALCRRCGQPSVFPWVREDTA